MARRSSLTIVALAVVGLMAVAGVLLAVYVAFGDGGLAGFGRVAVIDVEGVITEDESVLDQIREMRRDPSVRGFVVAINSPGGAVGPSQSIYRELRRIRDEDSVPVIASIAGVGASGGYYVALAADSILALPGSVTGSIGVLLEMPDASGLMDKVGVRMEVVKSAELKDAGSPFRPISPDDRAVLEAMVQDVFDQFLDVVRTERSPSPEVVAEVSDGRVLSGRQALERGLIDGFGNLNDALAIAGRMTGLGDEPDFVRPAQARWPLLDLLVGRGVIGAIGRAVPLLDTWVGPRLRYVIP